MFQVMYEYPEAWTDKETIQISGHFSGEIAVSPDEALRRANAYLGTDVAMAIQASDPVLIWRENPVWRLQANLYLRGWGKVSTLGTVDVDAKTKNVISLTTQQIDTMVNRANNIATRLTQTTTTSS